MSLVSEQVRIKWHQRASPLRPLGLIAVGSPARALATRLLRRSDEELLRLRGAAGAEALVVLGEAADLPWVDGVTYLGRDDRAPALLLPTHLEPDVGLGLVQAALLGRLAQPTTPVAVLPSPALLVPAGRARPIQREYLESWLREQR